MKHYIPLLYLFIFWGTVQAQQRAVIHEEIKSIDTYPFNSPDPVPVLGDHQELYPYFKYSDYSSEKVKKNWKVVTLENDYIKIEILPEVGGKIWGVTEKSTGYDFIYKNNVLKFRNIAMRGPWTSGGIEFNFGFFGHTPYASTPVNHSNIRYENGDVACVLGAMDLPSRTYWNVKITLPRDKAYFQIECTWHNPNQYSHPYYYWTNAAVRATQDLRFFYPGAYTVGHGGDVQPWPIDTAGRDLSWYRNNAFGGHKSYHILGENKMYKVAYRDSANVGTGSFSDKFNVLGQKLWIWSQAPSGAVWEDLLTDNDGQYVEIQSGRLYTQAGLQSGSDSPYTQHEFESYQTDSWSEYWFPVINTKGAVDVSRQGILNVERISPDSVEIRLMALEKINTKIAAKSLSGAIYEKEIKLNPVQTCIVRFPVKAQEDFEVFVESTDLYYSGSKSRTATKRPVLAAVSEKKNEETQLFRLAEENFKYRNYKEAEKKYNELLKLNPSELRTLTRLGEICLRTNRYDEAEKHLIKALEQDTYHGEANFLFGVLSSLKKEYDTAEESFAVASRSNNQFVSAHIETAKIQLIKKQYRKAMEHCDQALLKDARNITALKLKALSYRNLNNPEKLFATLEQLKAINPLDYFPGSEGYFFQHNGKTLAEVFSGTKENEFPNELLIESALFYASLGFEKEAIAIFQLTENSPVALYWLAYLDKENAGTYIEKADRMDIRFVFPYRNETNEVLKYAANLSSSWKPRYYLALQYWYWGDTKQAAACFDMCREPDSPWFYSVRGSFYQARNEQNRALQDYRKHITMDKSDWRVYHRLIINLNGEANRPEALSRAEEACLKFPSQFVLQYDYANLLLVAGRYKESLKILDKIEVLPAEHAGSAYPLYLSANLLEAIRLIEKKEYRQAIPYIEKSKEWPARLGAGQGYNPDFIMQDYLLNHCYTQTGEITLASTYRKLKVEDSLHSSTIDPALKGWLEAYNSRNVNRMSDFELLLEKERQENNTVSGTYLYLQICKVILAY